MIDERLLQLDKGLYERAVAAGITSITLSFSGGSDEGYLNVVLDKDNEITSELAEDIETWVWDNCNYSGAGDGNAYGDDVTYDLVNKKVTETGWYVSRTEEDSESHTFGIKDNTEEE